MFELWFYGDCRNCVVVFVLVKGEFLFDLL